MNSFLKRAHRLRTHCFLADGLRFRRCLFLSWLLLRRFLLRNPSLSQLPRRHHLLAGGSLYFPLLLLGFFFLRPTRAVPPPPVDAATALPARLLPPRPLPTPTQLLTHPP